MSKLTLRHIEECINDYDLFLFDLWGVIIEVSASPADILLSINNIIGKKEVIFLTNAPRPNYIVANNLRNMGIKDITPEKVITSGDVAQEIIVNFKNNSSLLPKIYHLGDDRNNDVLRDIDHTPTKNIHEADILVITVYRDEEEDIHEFDELLQKAASLPNLLILCANPDKIIPKIGGLRHGPGYFSSLIEQYGGKVVYTGKPESSIYDMVFERKKNISKGRILMIGDTFETDILGANRAGIDSALVLTGNSQYIHKMYDKEEDKLNAIAEYAKSEGYGPTFITKLIK